jgi:hypothetical protein
MKPRTYRRAVNSLTLAFDPLTWDSLKADARDRGESMERMAYLMIKAAVENKPVADNAPSAPDHTTVDTSSFAAFRQRDEREATGKL